jgi:hypothetical protein
VRAAGDYQASSPNITRITTGFAETQWKLFLNESPRRVKPLFVYRLLTGILMRG